MNVVGLCECVNGIVDSAARRHTDVDVDEFVRPLLDDQLEAIKAFSSRRAACHDQALEIPGWQTDETRLGHVLAASDVEKSEVRGLLQDPLDLRVVHAIEVAAAVDGDVELLQVRKAR